MRNRLLSSVAVATLAGAFALGMAASAMAQTSSPASPSAPSTRSTPPAAAGSSPSSSDQRVSPADLGGMSMDKLMGKTVYNAEGKKVGDINDFVVQASPGTSTGAGSSAGASGTPKQITYAVIGVGGFLGLGEKDVVVPVTELQVQGDRVQLSSNVTEDQLKQMPKYDKSQYRSVARNGSGTTGTTSGSSTAPRPSDTPARSSAPPAGSSAPSGPSAPSGTTR